MPRNRHHLCLWWIVQCVTCLGLCISAIYSRLLLAHMKYTKDDGSEWGEGYSHFFLVHRLSSSICYLLPKIFKILAYPQNIPILNIYLKIDPKKSPIKLWPPKISIPPQKTHFWPPPPKISKIKILTPQNSPNLCIYQNIRVPPWG